MNCLFITGDRLSNFVVGVTDTDPATTAPTPESLRVCGNFPGTGETGKV